MRPRVIVIGLLGVLAFGCQKSFPQNPRIALNPPKIDFKVQYIGTEPQMSLGIENQGIDDLVITGVDKAGDIAFSMTLAWQEGVTPPPLGTTVNGLESTFIRILFKPSAARAFSGSITLHSNAENGPDQMVELSGTGQTPPP